MEEVCKPVNILRFSGEENVPLCFFSPKFSRTFQTKNESKIAYNLHLKTDILLCNVFSYRVWENNKII